MWSNTIAGYKSQLFANLTRKKAAKIYETWDRYGSNLKYCGTPSGLSVVGVDPDRKMERYAQAAAEASGLHQTNFVLFKLYVIFMILLLSLNG